MNMDQKNRVTGRLFSLLMGKASIDYSFDFSFCCANPCIKSEYGVCGEFSSRRKSLGDSQPMSMIFLRIVIDCGYFPPGIPRGAGEG
jgi:hypothetical protein